MNKVLVATAAIVMLFASTASATEKKQAPVAKGGNATSVSQNRNVNNNSSRSKAASWCSRNGDRNQ
jgi:hypothetical protein